MDELISISPILAYQSSRATDFKSNSPSPVLDSNLTLFPRP